MPETTFHTTFSISHFWFSRAKNGSESGFRSAVSYRFGFNGKENDNEVKGTGNQQDYGMRIYDPRLGRFLSVDPLSRDYPMLTPYQFASNSPILCVDVDGMEGVKVTDHSEHTTTIILKILYVPSAEGSGFSQEEVSELQNSLNEYLKRNSFVDPTNSYLDEEGTRKNYEIKYEIVFTCVDSDEEAKKLLQEGKEYTMLKKYEMEEKRTPTGVMYRLAEASKKVISLEPGAAGRTIVEEAFHNLINFSENADYERMNQLQSESGGDDSKFEDLLHSSYGGIFTRNTGELNQKNIDDAINALPEKPN